MPRSVVTLLNNEEGQAIIRSACKQEGFLFPEFTELVQAEVEQTGKRKPSGLWDSFDDILDRIERIEEDD